MVRLESSVAPRILTFPDNLMSVPAALNEWRPDKDLSVWLIYTKNGLIICLTG